MRLQLLIPGTVEGISPYRWLAGCYSDRTAVGTAVPADGKGLALAESLSK